MRETFISRNLWGIITAFSVIDKKILFSIVEVSGRKWGIVGGKDAYR